MNVLTSSIAGTLAAAACLIAGNVPSAGDRPTPGVQLAADGTGNNNGNGNLGNFNGNGNQGNNNGNDNVGNFNGNFNLDDNNGNGFTGNNHGNYGGAPNPNGMAPGDAPDPTGWVR